MSRRSFVLLDQSAQSEMDEQGGDPDQACRHVGAVGADQEAPASGAT